MVDAGLLEGEPVELVDGLLVHVTPQGAQHAALVQRLTRQFAARAELLRVQLPLAVPDGRPEPDVALAQSAGIHEHPRTAALVVEVAMTSWVDDLAKLPSYAAAEVGVVWLINVPIRQVHVFEHPHERHYHSERVLAAGDTLHAPVDGVPPLPVSELFADFG